MSTRQSIPRPASNSSSSRVHKAPLLEGSRYNEIEAKPPVDFVLYL